MMNDIMIYSFFMLIFFMILFIYSILLYFYKISIMCEWLIYSFNSINMEFLLLIDWISLLFISFVMLISSMVLLYCCSYMNNEKFIDRFIYLVLLFIFSMVLMIISPNLISIMFGWDGLGLVSYCLVIYYQNFFSLNSGMLTVLCNRVGDVGLLMAIGLIMMQGSWNWFFMDSNKLIMFMVLLAAITKSAQIPFSSWLPSAMAAPTPVSALVHSSTLVTAGVYLMIRFNSFLMSSGISYYLLFLSVCTMFMAGLMANFENDLKKIIALSTLSQLGLMMMVLSIGFSMLSLFHLLTHAIFKSLLFLCAGAIIHLMNNNQDIRYYGNLNEIIPFVMISFYISSLSLCGYPFLSGFYSKDMIMESFYYNNINLMILIMSFLSLVFTVSYSLRLNYYLYFGEMMFFSNGNFKESMVMNISMMILLLLSIISGVILFWMFFLEMYFFMAVSVKLLTFMALVLGLVVGMYIYMKIFIKFYYSILFLSSMWYMNFMFMYIYKPFVSYGLWVDMIDKSWIEYMGKYMYKNLSMKFLSMKFVLFKIFMFMYLFIIIILIMMVV